MPDTPKTAEKPAASTDQLIRELWELIERRGWIATGSGIDQEDTVTVSARPKTDDE